MNTPSPTAPADQPHQEPLIRKSIGAISLVVLLAVPVFLLVVLQRSTNSRVLHVGDPIPAAALHGVAPGDALLAGINERLAAIFFFSVDCPHCQREIPIFNEVGKEFASEVEFIAIVLSDQQKTQSFVQTNDILARVLIDENGAVGKMFGVLELPAFFLVNHDHKIQWVGVGEQPRSEVVRRLSILVGKSLSTAQQGAENTRK
jgi:peroxiredoxin